MTNETKKVLEIALVAAIMAVAVQYFIQPRVVGGVRKVVR